MPILDKTLLPSKLEHEPLIEAIFEFRFDGAPEFSDLLPGYLFNVRAGEKSVKRLPAGEIPKAIRDSNTDLHFTPIVQIELDDYSILAGDRVMAISCKLPYKGWNNHFHDAIVELVKVAGRMNIIKNVHRYSLKYTNIIEGDGISQQADKINAKIRLGEEDISEHPCRLQVDITEGDTNHLITVFTGATATNADGDSKSGAVIDVDSIRSVRLNFDEWERTLSDDLNSLRDRNKQVFFGLLKEDTIKSLGPSYD